MIKPTIGRKVWFYPAFPSTEASDGRSITWSDDKQPLDATIVYVHNDKMINLRVSDQNGTSYPVTSVELVQEGEAPPPWRHCTWMPYQRGQAAKTESLEAQLGARNIPENIPTPPPGAVSSPEVPVPPGGLGYLEETLRARAVAPRVSLQDLEAEIAAEYCFTAQQGVDGADRAGESISPQRMELALLTIWVGVTRDGFTLLGKSAPASPANFDAEIGRRFAREDGMRQLWPLMGFRLRSQLASQAAVSGSGSQIA